MPGTAASTKRDARCVVLCPQGVEPSIELLAALDRKELTILRVRNEFAAMSRVCRLLKSTVDDMRSGRKASGVIMLLVEPRQIAKAPDLVHAVERYAPHAALWRYESETSPRMKPITPEDVSSWLESIAAEEPTPRHNAHVPASSTAPVAAHPKPSAEPRPQTMLPDLPLPAERTEPREIGQRRRDREPLSQAELSMLLADDITSDDNTADTFGARGRAEFVDVERPQSGPGARGV